MNVNLAKIKSFIAKHDFQKRYLISILQDIQAEYNYLPQEALKVTSESLKIPLIDIIGVATFYRSFSLQPKGKHQVTVCLGTACHVRGAPKILEEFERKLGIEIGQTTSDRLFSLDSVACLGCCAIGPVVVVDGNYHAQTTVRNVEPILKQHRGKEKKQ